MTQRLDHSDAEVAAIIDAYDLLVSQVERHLEQLESESLQAEASGDSRYQFRVQRGIKWSRILIDTLDAQVLDHIQNLRHNAHQLGTAREGKMV